MTQDSLSDQSKEKFRPQVDADLDKQIEAAMGGESMDSLVSEVPVDEGRSRIKGVQTGIVHTVDDIKGELLVELDGKNQGIAPLDQFEVRPEVGQSIEVFVDRFDDRLGIYRLMKKGAASTTGEWESINVGQILEGTITAMNKGGLEITFGAIKGFIPLGQVDVQFHKDVSVFLGQKAKVKVQKVDRRGKNLIVSRRALIEEDRAESKAKLFEDLAEGQTRRGTIRSVMEYGAFVDIGGADGLIHVSELSHRRGVKATDMVQVGDLVDVKIVKFDRESGKISLSLKQLMADPWAGVEAKYSVGTAITGRIARIEKFGAFVEVEEGLEGLLPVSEISWQRVNKVEEVLKVDDIVKLSVISIDPLNRKMSLSLKQSGPDPWKSAAEKYHKSDLVTVKISRVVDFGAFAEIEAGLEGLIHISEMADHRIKSANEVVKPGQTVETRIIDIDAEKRRISLSIKQVKAMAVPVTPEPVVDTNRKPRKPKELRGGLESGWFNKK